MKSFHPFDTKGNRKRESLGSALRCGSSLLGPGSATLLGSLWLAMLLATAVAASAQVVPAGDAEGLTYFAGATASADYLQYGPRKMLGITGFVDADARNHFGVEVEANWMAFHQTANVHTTSYAAGPRFRLHWGRFEPYAKGLVGIGEFNFPYNLAHGSYLVVVPGGGVDFRLSHRIRLRLAEAEYQYWPEFSYGSLSSFGVSSGIRVRIF